jgi:hypothetical protein
MRAIVLNAAGGACDGDVAGAELGAVQ